MAASAGNEGPNGNGEIGGARFMAFTGGLVVGPSLGYFYAGQPRPRLARAGLRILGYGALFGAVAGFLDCYGDGERMPGRGGARGGRVGYDAWLGDLRHCIGPGCGAAAQ